jgi:tetratricopeptide (TPR) repeat protein
MSQTCAPPCLFLSHSGADTDAARELKRRLLDSPDARAAGLRVWLDKDDLAAGLGWQAQLEKVISEEATAFAVHVGANGVMNWVESEVRLGLSRAAAAPDYPFIPILARECAGSAAMPLFARQYQGVRDPLNDPEEFVKLLHAVLHRSPDKKAVVLDSPFVGLKAMTEGDADRFFGRGEEIEELVIMLKQHRLIAIVADSGAGKSSLALAGLVPHFRGAALSDTAGREPDGRVWHVVVMRPRRDPIEGLKRGVTEAAERLGRSAEQCAALRKRISAADPSETAYAIRCDLPVGTTETLLIVDQFEELLTETAEAQRASMVDLLIALEAIGGFRIVLTLRADHFNLCRPFSKLFEHLTRNGQEAVLRLRRITDAGLIEAVRIPLRLAGDTDLSEQDAVINSIRRDITDRAGDLALVQMALYAMWQTHRADGVNLLVAYSQVGGVAGALAHEAERVRTQRLDATERPSLAPLFIRLVRLGETGGATRRSVDLADFDGPRRTLATRLATEDYGRLLLTGERTVEIAHEALITQWPWLQNTLNEAAGDMRVLDRLIDRARRWDTIGSRGPEHLATGAERTEFSALAQRRSDWLTATERDFVASSDEAERASRDRTRRRQQLERAAAVFFFALAVAITVASVWAYRAQREVVVERGKASQALATVAQTTNTLVYDLGPEFFVRGLPTDLMGRVFDRAIQGYDQALQLDPNNAAAYVGRGFANAIKGENDRAIQDYDRAIQVDPNNAAAYKYRGVAYGTKGNNRRAIQDLDQAIQFDPKDAVAYLSRGNAYSGNSDHDLAIKDYDQAIELDPQNAAPYISRGKAYISKNDYDRAIQDFDRAIELSPELPFGYVGRGDAYSGKNDQDRAIKDYGEAIQLDPKNAKNVSAYTGRGLAYVKKSDAPRALQDFDRAIQLDQKNAFAYVGRGDAYRSKNDSDRAIKDYDQAIQLDPKSAAAYVSRGLAYVGKGDVKRALQDFDQAIQLDPKNTLAYVGRGEADRSKNDSDRAIKDYDQAIQLDPKGAPAYAGRGIAYLGKGERNRAMQDLDRAIELDPKNATAYAGRGIAYESASDHDNAIQEFDHAIELDANVYVAYIGRGDAHRSKNDYDRAIQDYEQAIQLDQKNAVGYFIRGYTYAIKRDYDRAVLDYDQAIRLDPNLAAAFLNRGNAYASKGEQDRAIKDYDQAIDLDPKNPRSIDAYIGRGNTYVSKGSYDRAVPDYDQVIVLDPNNFAAFVNRGRAYFYLGNFGAGAADLLRAHELQEGAYPMIWRYLARERAGENAREELEANASRLKSADWPYPVVELYLGRRSPADLLSAVSGPDERCEAQFYIGEWDLLGGNNTAAAAALQIAADTCSKDFDEYTGALAELKRLKL